MRIAPDISGASIILLGSFNPRIFNPDWLVQKGVLGREEGAATEIEVIHRDVSAFKSDWFSVNVFPDRFQIQGTVEPLVRVRDFVVKVFGQYLPETPVTKLGINRQVHFSVRDFAVRDAIGERLAPKEAWGEWGPQISGRSRIGEEGYPKRHGGMLSLSMVQRDVPDRDAGHIQVKVEPSTQLACGIFLEINDHYEAKPEATAGASAMVAVAEKSWDESIKRSEWIVDQIMKLAHEYTR
jgi:hypothetical protein